jgi:hypothetical protein
MNAHQIIFNKKGLYSIILLFMLGSCINKDYDFSKASYDMVYDPKLAISIGTVNVVVDSLLVKYGADTIISTDEDGLLYITYVQEFPFQYAFELIATDGIGNQSFPLVMTPGTLPRQITQKVELPISFPQKRIDSVVIKQLDYSITVSSTYTQSGTLNISFPKVKDNTGNAFSHNFTLDNSGSYTSTITGDLAGSTMTFDSANIGNSYLPIDFDFRLNNPSGQPVEAGKQVTVTVTTSNFSYSVIYGYIGQNTVLDHTGSMNINFLNNQMAYNIEWADPQIKVSTENTYGVPVLINIDTMRVYSEIDDIYYGVNLKPVINPIQVAHSTNAYVPAFDSIKYNRSNTDFLDIALKSAPSKLYYQLSGTTNPDGDPKTISGASPNIMLDTSVLKARIEFTLPMYFRSSGFGSSDTLDFEMDADTGDVSLKSMVFRIETENGLPIDMKLQAYFVDSNYVKLDSLFLSNEQLIVSAGTTDAQGKVQTATKKVNYINFNNRQLRTVLNSKKIILKSSISTEKYNPDLKYVKFFAGYKLKIKLACQLQPEIIIND